jgi:hypothetical protein
LAPKCFLKIVYKPTPPASAAMETSRKDFMSILPVHLIADLSKLIVKRA